ncbi:MAG: primosomal protein [bacterium]|nr:primosomal protein [bacterium]
MNQNALNLLVEQPNYDINLLVEKEGPNKPERMFFEGIFMRCSEKNKNGRSYLESEMVNEANRYTKDMIETGRALGELNHPTSVEINPERACHIVTKITQEGNNFYGKSKILETPMGQIVRTLMMDGVKLGVSSRALGKVEESNDVKNVSDFRLICCDVVHDPSVDTAFVEGIFEAKQYILKCDGTVCEFVENIYGNLTENLCSLPKHGDAKQEKISTSVIAFIDAMKNM